MPRSHECTKAPKICATNCRRLLTLAFSYSRTQCECTVCREIPDSSAIAASDLSSNNRITICN